MSEESAPKQDMMDQPSAEEWDACDESQPNGRRSISPEDDVERPEGGDAGDEEGAEEASSSGVVVELPSSGNRDDEDDDQGANGEDQVPVTIGGEDQTTTTTTTTTSSSGNDGDEMPADAELSAILSRRCDINDALEDGRDLRVKNKVFNVYTEFPEFNMKEIKSFTQTFRKWDVDNDGYLNLTELKRMMECLGAPQTHVGLKEMIKDGGNEEKEGAISFREFMHVLRRARAGEFDNDSGLNNLAKLTEIDVDEVGVGGAKHFFEAKIKEQTVASKFEAEIKADKEERLKQTEEQKKRRAAFRDKAQFFEKGVAPASTAS